MRPSALVHKMDGGVLFCMQQKGDNAMDGDDDDSGNNDDNGNDDKNNDDGNEDNDRHVCAA
jgi:hypothetical protein